MQIFLLVQQSPHNHMVMMLGHAYYIRRCRCYLLLAQETGHVCRACQVVCYD